MSVLYVEDDKGVADTIKEVLETLFEKVAWAQHGGEGLKTFVEAEAWDLVITDINMPIMNGLEMIEAIKEINEEQDIVIISAHNNVDYLHIALRLGVRGFITKPFIEQQFRSEIYTVCKKIEEKKMLAYYIEMLEKTSLKLDIKNKQIDAFIQQSYPQKDNLHTYAYAEKTDNHFEIDIQINSQSEIKIFTDMREEHLDELPELEEELDIFSGYLCVSTTALSLHEVIRFSLRFQRYGQIMIQYSTFNTIGAKIIELMETVKTNPERVLEHQIHLSRLFESFAIGLADWRKSIFVEGTNNFHFYDKSLLSDMDSLIRLILNIQPECDFELF